jgi:hypothetical protein
MSDETQVPDPITALAEGAAQMHEMYAAYIDAGFPEPRAFELVKEMLAMTMYGNDG